MRTCKLWSSSTTSAEPRTSTSWSCFGPSTITSSKARTYVPFLYTALPVPPAPDRVAWGCVFQLARNPPLADNKRHAPANSNCLSAEQCELADTTKQQLQVRASPHAPLNSAFLDGERGGIVL